MTRLTIRRDGDEEQSSWAASYAHLRSNALSVSMIGRIAMGCVSKYVDHLVGIEQIEVRDLASRIGRGS
jgi:hypothetical protein